MHPSDAKNLKHARDKRSAQGSGSQVEPPERIRAAVFVPHFRALPKQGGGPVRDPAARLEEAVGLAHAIDLEIAGKGVIPVAKTRPATLFGTGKVEELAAIIRAHEAELVIIDSAVSPVQQRNLERAWEVKVLDRTGLILEIFGQRARTREGRLQVELAHLTYQKSRLVRSWTHLERQRGGFGFMGGPGETQIESDRRMIQGRITKITGQLDNVKRTRDLHRASRKKVPFPVVALVGYTNAGKSTLFNRLTDADVLVQDQVFATLDPTMRAVRLPHGMQVILSDTVGFISDLPTMLIAAFRATLEEVIEAEIILHVRDISHEEAEMQSRDVTQVLAALGIDDAGKRMIEAWNKVDRLETDERERLQNIADRRDDAVCVSAKTGQGADDLLALIESRINDTSRKVDVTIDAANGAGLSWLYENCEVLQRDDLESGDIALTIRVMPERIGRFEERFGAIADL